MKAIKTTHIASEQHELIATDVYGVYLETLSLANYKVLELGFGQGALTHLIAQQNPKAYLGVEIDTDLDPKIDKENFTFRYEDFLATNFDFLNEGNWVLIANPPYSCLQYIVDEIVAKYPLKGSLLMIPGRERPRFASLGFKEVLLFNGDQFEPKANGTHWIVKQGFPTTHRVESWPDEFGQHKNLNEGITQLEKDIVDTLEKKKLGQKRRVIVLLSKNSSKLPEYEKNLTLYGVEVFQADNIWQYDYIERILTLNIPNVRVMAVLYDSSNLYAPDSNKLAEMKNLNLAHNVARLCVLRRDEGGAISCQEYTHRTRGFIDLTRRRPAKEGVFGWDDIFIVSDLNKSYHELLLENRKVSSRDMNLSKYIEDSVHYREPVNLQFGTTKNQRTIDFSNAVTQYVRSSPYLLNPAAKENGLADFFLNSASGGIFFRAAQNRRHKNYWWPGLNAGLPFTPKRDEIHEATYMSHDFIHFLIPDLIFHGKTDAFTQRVYITYRMMSEGLTLVFSDMLFADSLKRSFDNDYDYTKRCFQPVYEACGLPITSKKEMQSHIRTLCHANVQYCLTGEDTELRQLITANNGDLGLIEKFKAKYMPFFVEDFRWTVRNFANMSRKADEFRRWWDLCEPIRELVSLDLQTTSEFISSLACGKTADRDELIEAVFDLVFARRITPVLRSFDQKPKETNWDLVDQDALRKGFARYMMGQFGLYARFHYQEETKWHAKRLANFIQDELQGINLEKIARARDFFADYIDLLQRKNLISLDDANTYKEIYPLFEPVYVFYDEKKDFYTDLREVSREILISTPLC